MDFLNKYFAQIRELFEGMTPGARITSALLLAVTVVALGYLVSGGVGSGGEVFLLDNRAFPSDELAAMEGAFATEGLGDYEIVGGRIQVPRSRKTDYVAALAKGSALPHGFSSILDGALEKSGTFEDNTKFQARLLLAKQQYLSEVFRSIKEYERAGVLISEKTEPGLRMERTLTASVSIKPIGTMRLDDNQVQSICQTMVGAVAGLKAEDVVVTDLNSGRARRGSASDSADGLGSSMFAEQQKQEIHYREKIQRLLSGVTGVIVTPTVELAPEKIHTTTSTTFDDKNSISVHMEETKTSRDSTGASKGGRPGAVAQGNTSRSLGTTESKGSQDNEKTSTMSESKLPAGEQTEKVFAPHVVQRVAVAIAVPTSYFTEVWRKRNPTPPGEDPPVPSAADIDQIRTEQTTEIKSIVAGALPEVVGVTDPTELVAVTDFEDIIPPPIPEPTLTENAGTWFGNNWSTMGLLLLGLFSLVMLRSMIRSAPAGGSLEPMNSGAGAGAGAENTPRAVAGEIGEEESHMAFSGTGASLRDDLSNLVANDPETAANILKNWIGSPASQ